MNHPLLCEINTRCWLRELSRKHGASITLGHVPETEFAGWQQRGFTHIWLMGVWTTGPLGRAEPFKHADLRRAFDTVLPGWKPEDVDGSPYAIADYQVPPALGGDAGLKKFRGELHQRGMKLILDFVPNHLGFDHPWTVQHPELFVQSPVCVPGTFRVETPAGPHFLAHGKDPHFYPWSDTVQVDYRRADARRAMSELLLSIAARCDGVRCDMAMLLLNDVFAKTWAHFPAAGDSGLPPAAEFWTDAIPAVKRAHPGFIFLAEVYWALEGRLQTLGFDYTCDKHLFDLLVSHRPQEVSQYFLNVPVAYISASAHFLENHDEERIAPRLTPDEHRAAALVILGLPGMRFLHEGQLAGDTMHIPVQLGRRPVEPVNLTIAAFYEKMLHVIRRSAVGHGEAKLLPPRRAWDENPTADNFVLVQWQVRPLEFDLVVVNLAPHRSQCYAPLDIECLADRNWQIRDLLGDEQHERYGDDLQRQGLYLDVPACAAQIFRFEPQ